MEKHKKVQAVKYRPPTQLIDSLPINRPTWADCPGSTDRLV